MIFTGKQDPDKHESVYVKEGKILDFINGHLEIDDKDEETIAILKKHKYEVSHLASLPKSFPHQEQNKEIFIALTDGKCSCGSRKKFTSCHGKVKKP